ncbi:hypothetical protein LQG66_04240 [Bradyrhizobium ontarionense]|uniref:Uncharacterized protein n=1 Tax=Bradyrhizobium ontarionense TaxID=2898149 RepID=A0ABY3REY4_9BRAD|nr:hypothetical protein [Bradyrhizobium sp. A19]UFZ05535.1 hypothetical protein LQG66_04240 [Bradyrhizobium sp. A19]
MTTASDRKDFRKRVSDDLDITTAALTDRSRVISLGIVALCWAFIIGELPKTGGIKVPAVNLLGPIFLALCAILSDWLQFLFGYFSSLGTLRAIEADPNAANEYDVSSLRYRLRFAMFYAKQVFCFAAAIWFLLAILLTLLSAWAVATGPGP